MNSYGLTPNLTPSTGQAQASRLEQLQAAYQNPVGRDQKKLKQAAQEFEAIFVQQLLDAMDKTVDRENSLLSGGSSEDYWRSMLNEHVAKSMCVVGSGSGFGLAENIYRQMAENMDKTAQSASVDKSKPIVGSGQYNPSGEVNP